MAIDTKLQLKLLEELRAAYPEPVDFQSRAEFTEQEFQATLLYLKEHGFIDGAESTDASAVASTRIAWARITARGVDFLRETKDTGNRGQRNTGKARSSLLNNGWMITVGAVLILLLMAWWLAR